MAASKGQAAAAANNKGRNPADENDAQDDEFELPAEFAGQDLVQVSTGFPPYLVIEEGVRFACKVKGLDLTDPDFIRFVCENIGGPLKCNTGKRADGVDVVVDKGDEFTVSWYATLPLEWAMANATPLLITPLAKDTGRTLPSGAKAGSMWRFSYETTAVGKKQIDKERTRALAFGRRTIIVEKESQPNPNYLSAFTDGAAVQALTSHRAQTINAEA